MIICNFFLLKINENRDTQLMLSLVVTFLLKKYIKQKKKTILLLISQEVLTNPISVNGS